MALLALGRRRGSVPVVGASGPAVGHAVPFVQVVWSVAHKAGFAVGTDSTVRLARCAKSLRLILPVVGTPLTTIRYAKAVHNVKPEITRRTRNG